MKILCVIDSLCQGGAQRQLIELALGFKERGHDVAFLTYHNIPFFNNILDEAGITNCCIERKNYFLRMLEMRAFIRRGNFSAVLSFLEASSFICEIAGLPYRKWKLIVGERSANPGITNSFKLIVYRWFHFFSDYIVANSISNMSLVRKISPFLPIKKCVIIYNSIDLNSWKPSERYVLKRDGKLRILIAAGNRPSKNLKGLIDALSYLDLEERRKIIIEWYGFRPDDDLSQELLQISKYHLEEVISLRPAVKNIIEITQNADVVALFSYFEGFPNSLCEGMACSKVIVSSNVSDIAFFLKENQNLLCDPYDPVSISTSLKNLLLLSDEELTSIGKRNRKIAETYFNKVDIVNKYLELFK